MVKAELARLRRLYHHIVNGGTIRLQDISKTIEFIEKLDMYPVFDIIQRLWQSGHIIKEQEGRWWLFDEEGEGLVSGKDFKELCVNIVLTGL